MKNVAIAKLEELYKEKSRKEAKNWQQNEWKIIKSDIFRRSNKEKINNFVVHQKLFCILGATIIFIEDYLVRAMVIIHCLYLSMSSYMTSCPLRYIDFIWSKYHWVHPKGEMIFGPAQNANDFLFPTKCSFFQYCYNNIRLFSIAPHLVISLPALR